MQRRWLIFLFTILICFLSLKSSWAEYALVSSPKERKLGIEVLKQINQQTPIIHSLLWQDYFEKLGNYLVGFSSKPASNITFFIVKSDQINAFALPGKIIVFNSELILKTADEAELAAVLSHEIAHVIQRHFNRIMEQYYQGMFSNIAAILASVIIGGAISPEVSQAGIYSTVAAGHQNLINYTRDHEFEADRIGSQILTYAGYPSSAMASFLAKLPTSRYHKDYSALFTHPIPEKRQAEALNIKSQRKTEDYIIATKKDYALLKMNLEVITTNRLNALEKKIQTKLIKNPDNIELNYALGLIYLKDHQNKMAFDIFQKIYLKNKDDIIIGIAYIDSLLKTNQLNKANKVIEHLLKNNPSSLLVLLMKVDYLAKINAYDQARLILHRLIYQYPNKAQLDKLLAENYFKLKNEGAGHYYLAQYYYKTGQIGYAMAQLKLVKKHLESNSRYYLQAQEKEKRWQKAWLGS